MEVDQIKTGGDMKVECKFRSGGDMPTPPWDDALSVDIC